LSSQGPQTVTALAEHLDVHASTMTRMCTRLVTRGLVVRVPSAVDRREVVITLSTNGSRLVDDVLNNRRAEFDAIVQRLSEEHRHTLIGALDAFSRAAIDEDPSGRNGEIASDRAFISPEETS
jgi:DNA-binding MarR family transcriptional regulator